MSKLRRTLGNMVKNYIGQEIMVKGWVHEYRALSKMAFIVLREHQQGSSVFTQIFIPKDKIPELLRVESTVEIIGTPKLEPQCKYGGVEIVASEIKILSLAEVLPFPLNTPAHVPFHTLNDHRPWTIRGDRERAIFKIQAMVLKEFRGHLNYHGFTEINSTKLSAAGLEGGGELFKVKYFGTEVALTQSPQFYKQMMVGAFERVFEIGKVYRAEGSSTNKHLTEFIGLDVEMGFIESANDVMDLEERLIKGIFGYIGTHCKSELEILGISDLNMGDSHPGNIFSNAKIPRITYNDAIQVISEKTGIPDINSAGELALGEYIKGLTGSDFVFITDYPIEERPFYVMPKGDGLSDTFDLLYKGIEITSGGMRQHNFSSLVAAMVKKRLDPRYFESYLMPFKYGMPPHGGFGMGLERLLKQMLNLDTADEASLIPRTKERYYH